MLYFYCILLIQSYFAIFDNPPAVDADGNVQPELQVYIVDMDSIVSGSADFIDQGDKVGTVKRGTLRYISYFKYRNSAVGKFKDIKAGRQLTRGIPNAWGSIYEVAAVGESIVKVVCTLLS